MTLLCGGVCRCQQREEWARVAPAQVIQYNRQQYVVEFQSSNIVEDKIVHPFWVCWVDDGLGRLCKSILVARLCYSMLKQQPTTLFLLQRWTHEENGDGAEKVSDKVRVLGPRLLSNILSLGSSGALICK